MAALLPASPLRRGSLAWPRGAPAAADPAGAPIEPAAAVCACAGAGFAHANGADSADTGAFGAAALPPVRWCWWASRSSPGVGRSWWFSARAWAVPPGFGGCGRGLRCCAADEAPPVRAYASCLPAAVPAPAPPAAAATAAAATAPDDTEAAPAAAPASGLTGEGSSIMSPHAPGRSNSDSSARSAAAPASTLEEAKPEAPAPTALEPDALWPCRTPAAPLPPAPPSPPLACRGLPRGVSPLAVAACPPAAASGPPPANRRPITGGERRGRLRGADRPRDVDAGRSGVRGGASPVPLPASLDAPAAAPAGAPAAPAPVEAPVPVPVDAAALGAPSKRLGVPASGWRETMPLESPPRPDRHAMPASSGPVPPSSAPVPASAAPSASALPPATPPPFAEADGAKPGPWLAADPSVCAGDSPVVALAPAPPSTEPPDAPSAAPVPTAVSPCSSPPSPPSICPPLCSFSTVPAPARCSCSARMRSSRLRTNDCAAGLRGPEAGRLCARQRERVRTSHATPALEARAALAVPPGAGDAAVPSPEESGDLLLTSSAPRIMRMRLCSASNSSTACLNPRSVSSVYCRLQSYSRTVYISLIARSSDDSKYCSSDSFSSPVLNGGPSGRPGNSAITERRGVNVPPRPAMDNTFSQDVRSRFPTTVPVMPRARLRCKQCQLYTLATEFENKNASTWQPSTPCVALESPLGPARSDVGQAQLRAQKSLWLRKTGRKQASHRH
jgi:hypothetical protein